MHVRALEESDRPALEAYMASRVPSTMHMADNLARHGVAAGEGRYSGEFLGAYEGERLQGVAQLVRVGSVLLACERPDAAQALAEVAAGRDFQPLRLLGMRNELEAFQEAWGAVRPLPVRHTSDAALMSLGLEQLQPQDMTGFRAATTLDLPTLVPWQKAFELAESLTTPDRQDDAEVRARLEAKIGAGRIYMLDVKGRPASMASLGATAHDCILLGGIFTPEDLRGEGHSTRLVAAVCHFHLSALGARAAHLFVDEGNAAGVRVYEKVGFRRTGTYRLVMCD